MKTPFVLFTHSGGFRLPSTQPFTVEWHSNEGSGKTGTGGSSAVTVTSGSNAEPYRLRNP